MVEAGKLRNKVPVLVASVNSATPEQRDWFYTTALRALVQVFGEENIRVCHSCMKTEVNEIPGKLEWRSTLWNTGELATADKRLRKEAEPAKLALYISEMGHVVSVRAISMENSTILFASNFDSQLTELRRTENLQRYHIELKNRQAGAGHMHLLWDGMLYPNQHLAVDILDQFGARGEHLAGISTSLFTPLLGVGFAYHYVFQDAWNISLGAKVLFAGPNLLLRLLLEQDIELIDPLLNTVFVVRVPVPETNFAVSGMIATGSDAFPFPTQFPTFGLGITLLNPTLLPVLP